MSNAPSYDIDPQSFWDDPYPDLKVMRETAPIAYVPQLGATLLTKRDDIFVNEKRTDVFSSHQPDGLMVQLMGENMMRKDGESHRIERRAIFPALSPKTVRDVWTPQFEAFADSILDDLAPRGSANLVRDFAMPVSAEALKVITGLTNMNFAEMDRVSQGMIDGCANYTGDLEVEARCHDCTASIDRHIDEMMPKLTAKPDRSVLGVQLKAGLPDTSIRANVKLVISGGQNEPRDVIAGAIWALLAHPEQRVLLENGKAGWADLFDEYTRWISPIGMSPRRIDRTFDYGGVRFDPGDRVFLMFSSANRDKDVFDDPDRFRIKRETTASVVFGSGPHFCLGAAAAKALVTDVALPKAFARLPNLRLDPSHDVQFGGWAFRGPLGLNCLWDVA